jgi:hypothetical protein
MTKFASVLTTLRNVLGNFCLRTALIALPLAVSCVRTEANPQGSETHFFEPCVDECGNGEQCVDGRCVEPPQEAGADQASRSEPAVPIEAGAPPASTSVEPPLAPEDNCLADCLDRTQVSLLLPPDGIPFGRTILSIEVDGLALDGCSFVFTRGASMQYSCSGEGSFVFDQGCEAGQDCDPRPATITYVSDRALALTGVAFLFGDGGEEWIPLQPESTPYEICGATCHEVVAEVQLEPQTAQQDCADLSEDCGALCTPFAERLDENRAECTAASTLFVGRGCGYDVLGSTSGPGATSVQFYDQSSGQLVGSYYIGDAGDEDNECTGFVPSACHQYRVEFDSEFDVHPLCESDVDAGNPSVRDAGNPSARDAGNPSARDAG